MIATELRDLEIAAGPSLRERIRGCAHNYSGAAPQLFMPGVHRDRDAEMRRITLGHTAELVYSIQYRHCGLFEVTVGGRRRRWDGVHPRRSATSAPADKAGPPYLSGTTIYAIVHRDNLTLVYELPDRPGHATKPSLIANSDIRKVVLFSS